MHVRKVQSYHRITVSFCWAGRFSTGKLRYLSAIDTIAVRTDEIAVLLSATSTGLYGEAVP